MPQYKHQLVSDKDTPDGPILHVFEYSHESSSDRPAHRKDIVALESCIFVNRWSMAKRRARRMKREEAERIAKEENVNNEGTTPEASEEHPSDTLKTAKKYPSDTLNPGQEFDGYVIKCANGPYDYALKLWDTGRVAPWDGGGYPKENEEIPALVIDRNGDYLTIACGSNVAYATKKSFSDIGVNPDDLSLPFGRLKVTLSKAETRPSEVSVAAWVAKPTEISFPSSGN